jgi:hypothetical protein
MLGGAPGSAPEPRLPLLPPLLLIIRLKTTANFPINNIKDNKRQRKTRQLPQFKVYKNVNSVLSGSKLSSQNEFTLALIKQELSRIRPYFTVEIPLYPDSRYNCCEFHSNSTAKTLIKGS